MADTDRWLNNKRFIADNHSFGDLNAWMWEICRQRSKTIVKQEESTAVLKTAVLICLRSVTTVAGGTIWWQATGDVENVNRSWWVWWKAGVRWLGGWQKTPHRRTQRRGEKGKGKEEEETTEKNGESGQSRHCTLHLMTFAFTSVHPLPSAARSWGRAETQPFITGPTCM